ncbi:hypothetical protein REX01_000690 [Klebsiella aerogenes]|nr:hypothetical protein [Klebsiella aerogenes]
MFKKLLQKKSTQVSEEMRDELNSFFEEIDAKQKEVADKKAKIREDHERGARITKHRFSV